MPKKQPIVSEVASVLGAAAARVEQTLTPKRSKAAKHTMSKGIPAETNFTEPVAETGMPEYVPGGAAQAAPDRGEIAQLAYLYWEARGRENGSEEEDWLRAEHDLKQRH